MTSNKTMLKQYFTSSKLANILVDNVEDFITPSNVVDLSVGEGELLNSSFYRWGEIDLFGVDIDKLVIEQLTEKYSNRYILNNSDGIKIKYQTKFEKFFKLIEKGGFDLCIANPPFDRFNKVNIAGKSIAIPLEILFLEKYIDICKDGGFIAIILPNGILTNNSYREFRDWMLTKVIIRRVISIPIEAFPEVSTKTEILILEKVKNSSPAIIEFKKYDNSLDLIEKFTLKLNKEQLIKRMDFDFYNVRNKSSTKIDSKIVQLKKFHDILIDHGRGATVYGKERFFVKSGVRYIHSTNIGYIGVNFEKEELFVDKNSVMYKQRALTKLNDILVIRVGNNAGKTAMVCSESEIGVASDCLYIFRLDNKVNPYYFTALMMTDYMKEKLNYLKHGSCSKVISKRDLLELEIPIISRYAQEHFGKEISDTYFSYLNKTLTKDNYLIVLNNIILKIDGYIRGEYNE